MRCRNDIPGRHQNTLPHTRSHAGGERNSIGMHARDRHISNVEEHIRMIAPRSQQRAKTFVCCPGICRQPKCINAFSRNHTHTPPPQPKGVAHIGSPHDDVVQISQTRWSSGGGVYCIARDLPNSQGTASARAPGTFPPVDLAQRH